MIPIQNVYYMLSYAFRVLNEQGYKSIETEEFHNVAELCASILTKGVSLQLKRGLGKEYISETEALSSPRGKIDVTASIKDLSKVKGQLVCTYDDFSVNSYMNKIIDYDGVAVEVKDISGKEEGDQEAAGLLRRSRYAGCSYD